MQVGMVGCTLQKKIIIEEESKKSAYKSSDKYLTELQYEKVYTFQPRCDIYISRNF